LNQLDFDPQKSKEEFKKNYRLHDRAETYLKNLFIQWGIKYSSFGKDKRNERVWENGRDKPDLLIKYKGKKALLELKSKHDPVWLINKRAIEAYEEWKKKLKFPLFIVFFVFNQRESLLEIRIADTDVHHYIESEEKEWDQNITVEFEKDLPVFTKVTLLKYLNL
jgi:hypothetical protein